MTVPSRRSAAPARAGAWLSVRRGVALFLALVTVVLIALLAVGIAHLAYADFKRGRDAATIRQAANAADVAAFSILRDWPLTPHESVPVGGTMGPDTLWLPNAIAERWSTRASRTTWWSVGVGSAGDSIQRTLSRRSVQVSYRLALPEPIDDAALEVRDSLALAGGARVVGTDTSLATWGPLCALPSDVAGVAMSDTTRLCDGSCGAGSVGGRVAGLPPLLADTGASNTARYAAFGHETWASLTRRASIVLSPGSIVSATPSVTGSTCDRSAANNWGDPIGGGACAQYAPLIWATGDLELRGGIGQGVLLVEGDLTLSAGALFAGVVIARDDLASAGIGGTILGLAMAGDARVAPGDHSRLDGSTLVRRSRCAIDRALEWSAPLIPIARRSWASMR